MNNEKRFECDVVVMPGAELDTDICITGNVYMEIGTNEIEFTPQEEGEYIYSCWMNMIKIK